MPKIHELPKGIKFSNDDLVIIESADGQTATLPMDTFVGYLMSELLDTEPFIQQLADKISQLNR